MEIVNLSLPATNRFATEYLTYSMEVQRNFHYRYDDQLEYEKRLHELMGRSYMRMELANHIEQYMENFPTSNQVRASLKKLKQSNSTVVIGGQQAGILTGPLYSIHKIISIIALAKQKEQELNIPVVPVFWIAGEDHDYQEVNHVYIEKDHKLEKKIYPEKLRDKRMVSDILLDQDQCLSWVDEIIQSFGETEHTKQLLDCLESAIRKSTSFVDFFAHIIMELFKESGLLIIDSGDKKLRTLEREFFIKQINNFKEITKSVKDQQAELNNCGFPSAIEMSKNAVNLFYYDNEHNERILLEYDETKDVFYGKDGLFQFSMEKMLEIAGEFPEKLSNNVVTRPIMQEWLFPTLAFIAGPGEIAYWAELKTAFELFGLKMPPIVPRLNITILDRSIERDLKELDLDLQETLIFGIEKKKEEFLHSLKNLHLEKIFNNTKLEFQKNYEQLESYLQIEDRGLIPLLKKNEKLILNQLDFMESKLEHSVHLKNEVVINKYNKVGNALRPLGSPQERIINGLFYINQYGLNFIDDLLENTFTFDGTHKLIRI
ncbi:bacillithiol biosynthesis cysteine-adding enzyme BshC [Cytobacillus dafuensis]|uniref:Putative cysteine ligase BshC n=1 Tax=Cytobacillus dafuensis TaxID=1742359 RepID=A0A5B8Z2X0_CYTDA|nr:bacillithiol biosynthesis cysteine-adding enzyme BshC [Cytobacillus dafuensis]QED47440.1 bacillithiol biosynthesis cysteine-adding enzyme BshC [Cytobacillus dafuensis]